MKDIPAWLIDDPSLGPLCEQVTANIKVILLKRDLKQEYIQRHSAVDKGNLSRYFSGARPYTLLSLKRIAEALEVDIAQLMQKGPAPSRPVAPTTLPIPVPTPLPKKPYFTILVIDGVAEDPHLFTKFLAGEGHFVFRAETNAEALAQTRKFHPNLILLGGEKGGVGSLKLLPQLLKEQAGAAVVMVAKDPSVPEAVAAMKLGAAGFLELPLTLKALQAAIREQEPM